MATTILGDGVMEQWNSGHWLSLDAYLYPDLRINTSTYHSTFVY